MKDRKLYTILENLSPDELDDFLLYVNSPYNNSNIQISTLVETVIGFYRIHKSSEWPEDSLLWGTITQGDIFDATKLNRVFAHATALLESFLACEELQSDLFTISMKRSEISGALGNKKLLRQSIKEAKAALDRFYTQDSAWFHAQYKISGIETMGDEKPEIPALEIFYLVEKLKLYNTLASWKKMYNLNIELDHMDQVFKSANAEKFRQIPAVDIYHKMTQTFLEENVGDHYFQLRKLMKSHIHLFPKQEQNAIYTTAISYCINKINKSQLDFSRETFEVYREAVEKGFTLSDNEISASDFRNIVVVALRVNEIEWATHFIEQYAGYLQPKFRHNAVQFSLARVEMYRKNYKKVLDHLIVITFEDVWYNLGVKTMQLAAYYELEEFDALESLLNAFKMFINREKSLTKDRKSTYLLLIKFTQKLMRIMPGETQKIQRLKQEIMETKGVVSKAWLLEKISEFEQVKKKSGN
jgi:hypothetical protein